MPISTAGAVFAGFADLGGEAGELDADWERLAERCAAPPFLHPAVVRAGADAFGSGPLSLACVRHDGELVAALPVHREGRRISSVVNWHTVQTGVLATDAVARRLLASVLVAARPHMVTLELLPPGDAELLTAAFQDAGYRTTVEPMIASPYLDVGGDFDALVGAWPSKKRHEQRRLRRRLGELGTLTVETTTDGDGALATYQQLLELEDRGWKASGGTAIARQQATLRFYGAMRDLAAGRGWLRMDTLRLDDRPIAVSMGLEAERVYYGLKMGSDPELRRRGPGVLLLEDVVRIGFERGLERIELLGDVDSYKLQWADRTRELVRLRAFAPSLPGTADFALRRYGPPLARRIRCAVADTRSRVRERTTRR